MADKQNKKKKTDEKKAGTQKHKQNILELIGGMDGINQYIEGFSESSEQKMTDGQKQFMRQYALQTAEKWSETIYKMEEALKDPDVIDALEKKLKTKPTDQKKQE